MIQSAAVGCQVIGRDVGHAVEAAFVAPADEAFEDVPPTVDGPLAAVPHPHRLQELVDQDLRLRKVVHRKFPFGVSSSANDQRVTAAGKFDRIIVNWRPASREELQQRGP